MSPPPSADNEVISRRQLPTSMLLWALLTVLVPPATASSSGSAAQVLTTVVNRTLSSGPVSTRVLHANDALYFGTGGVNLTCVGATNATVLFVTAVVPTSAVNLLAPIQSPVLANGNVFLVGSGSVPSEPSWTIYAIAGGGTGTVTAIPSPTWGAACSDASAVSAYGPLVVSPDERYVYFAAGLGRCVVQLATTAPFTATATTQQTPVWQTPLAIGNYVYTAANGGDVVWARAASSTTTASTWASSAWPGTNPGDFAAAAGLLYFTASSQLFKYDELVLSNQGVLETVAIPTGYGVGGVATNHPQFAPALYYRGLVYTIIGNGSLYGVAAVDPSGNWIDTTAMLRWTSLLPGATSPLTTPAISPDGIFVFASSAGVFAMTFQGKALWSRTGMDCGDYTNYPTSFQIPVIRMGVVYVVCDQAMHLMDLYRNGTDWQVGPAVDFPATPANPNSNTAAGVQFFVNPTTETVVLINQAQYTVINVSVPLYSASQLPAPLPPYEATPSGGAAGHTLWIAVGVSVGVVAVGLLAVIAKRRAGRRRNGSDYIAMHSLANPVNPTV